MNRTCKFVTDLSYIDQGLIGQYVVLVLGKEVCWGNECSDKNSHDKGNQLNIITWLSNLLKTIW